MSRYLYIVKDALGPSPIGSLRTVSHITNRDNQARAIYNGAQEITFVIQGMKKIEKFDPAKDLIFSIESDPPRIKLFMREMLEEESESEELDTYEPNAGSDVDDD